jgi:GNAT superfamily N-acetyltransferase
MELRPAQQHEAGMCYQCIEDARAYHKSLGFEQWHPDYPTRQTILDDIAQGIGYAFTDDTGVIGYCCIVIGDEPAYHEIDGAWKTDRPYAVVHRMAFNRRARGSGLSHEAFQHIEDYCLMHRIDAIRLDTQEENKVMQHILGREGFEYCGMVQFDGGPKLAYEWDRSIGV